MNIIFIAGSVILWGAVHSWLASNRAKEAAERLLGVAANRWYRLAFNGFSGLTIVPVLALTRLLPDEALYSIPSPWLYAMLAGQLAAVVCLAAALMQTDALDFLGLRQLTATQATARLNTRGFYALVRHPLYLFGLLILWLTPIMSANTFTLFAALSVYLFVGARFEEQRLLREYGPEYEDYRHRTPMIIPGLMVTRGHPAQDRRGRIE